MLYQLLSVGSAYLLAKWLYKISFFVLVDKCKNQTLSLPSDEELRISHLKCWYLIKDLIMLLWAYVTQDVIFMLYLYQQANPLCQMAFSHKAHFPEHLVAFLNKTHLRQQIANILHFMQHSFLYLMCHKVLLAHTALHARNHMLHQSRR